MLPALCVLATACVSGPAPANHSAALYAPEQDASRSGHPQGDWDALTAHASKVPACTSQIPRELANYRRASPGDFLATHTPLAPGDRLAIRVLGDSDRLTGTYVVGTDGAVRLRGVPHTRAGGGTLEQFETALRTNLVASGVCAHCAMRCRFR